MKFGIPPFDKGEVRPQKKLDTKLLWYTSLRGVVESAIFPVSTIENLRRIPMIYRWDVFCLNFSYILWYGAEMGGLAEHFGFASALNPYNFGIVGFLIDLADIISRSFHDLSGEPTFVWISLISCGVAQKWAVLQSISVLRLRWTRTTWNSRFFDWFGIYHFPIVPRFVGWANIFSDPAYRKLMPNPHDLSGEPYFLRSSLSKIYAESPRFIGETFFVWISLISCGVAQKWAVLQSISVLRLRWTRTISE